MEQNQSNTPTPDQGVSSGNPQATASVAALPEVLYAGFWRRFGAGIIDMVILGVAVSILSFIFGNAAGIFNTLGAWLYFAFFESSVKQATPGKMVLHLQVTDDHGRKLSFWRATGRHFAKIISAIILFIGYLMIGWTKKKQGLHDIIAKTLVIRHQ